jgi:hypothetical protein
MPAIRCTSKLPADIDDPPAVTSAAPSAIGDWYGHIFTLNRRKCIHYAGVTFISGGQPLML